MCTQVPSKALAGAHLGGRNHGDIRLHDNSKAHVNTTGAEPPLLPKREHDLLLNWQLVGVT